MTSEAKVRFKGVPKVLLPRSWPTPRDLEKRPFDYRNPFPAWDEKESRENGVPVVRDETAAGSDYYTNDRAAIGLSGGPECALVDLNGTLQTYTGGGALGIGPEAAAPAARLRTLDPAGVPIPRATPAIPGGTLRLTWFSTSLAGTPEVEYPFTRNGGCFQWTGGPEPVAPNLFHRVRGEFEVERGHAPTVELRLEYAQAGSLCAGAYYMQPRYSPPMSKAKWRKQPNGCWPAGGPWRLTGRYTAPPVGRMCWSATGDGSGRNARAFRWLSWGLRQTHRRFILNAPLAPQNRFPTGSGPVPSLRARAIRSIVRTDWRSSLAKGTRMRPARWRSLGMDESR